MKGIGDEVEVLFNPEEFDSFVIAFQVTTLLPESKDESVRGQLF